MKKVILGCGALFLAYQAVAQVVVSGVSPSAIQRNFEHGVQANAGGWPGETDDQTWGFNGSGLNFNNPGEYIMDTLVLANDGATGVNAQGNPAYATGCDSIPAGSLTGKIAMMFRYDGVSVGSCSFATKVLNAQKAGAIAAIIVNREDALISMLGNATDGIQVTIPAVAVSLPDGITLRDAVLGGPVVMFIGNKMGAFTNDIGSDPGSIILAPQASRPAILAQNAADYSFTPGIQFVNYGQNAQNNAVIRAKIDSPSQAGVYNETVTVTMNPGDTIPVFEGNSNSFPAFAPTAYEAGEYTITYSIELAGVADDNGSDNTFSNTFYITNNVLSYGRYNSQSNASIMSSFPRNYDDGYKSCMSFIDPNASRIGVSGITFAMGVEADSLIAGQEVALKAYEWGDADYTLGAGTFDVLTEIGTASWYSEATYTNESVVTVNFDTPFLLNNDQKYLFCLEAYTGVPSFGFDSGINYSGNASVYDQTLTPIYIDNAGTAEDRWYNAGWSGGYAPGITLNIFPEAELSLQENANVNGMVYPNPANDKLNFSLTQDGNATVILTDISGKAAASTALTVENGKAAMSISNLATGMYVATVVYENGKTAQFNVVKK